MPFLELKNIDVFYGDVQVVFGLSLKVEEGEVVSIIGSNGAGKSTLLKTISGLMAPARGEIFFEGFPTHDQPPEKIVERGIVQVPEGRRLFTHHDRQGQPDRGCIQQPRRPAKGKNPPRGFGPAAPAQREGVTVGHDPFGWRAADGRHRQGADGPA